MPMRSLAAAAVLVGTVVASGPASAVPMSSVSGPNLIEKAQVVVNKTTTVVRRPPAVIVPRRPPMVVQKKRVIIR